MQCGKLEPLSAFEGFKRSCITQLARRRAGAAAKGDDAAAQHRRSIKLPPGTRTHPTPAPAAAPLSTTHLSTTQPAGGDWTELPAFQTQQQQLPGQSAGFTEPAAPWVSAPGPQLQPPPAALDPLAAWQQLAPVTLSHMAGPQDLEQQRLLLQHKMAVIDTQMALLQEQRQVEAEMLTLHQEYHQRQQQLQTRLQHTQQQMLVLRSMQPDLPTPALTLGTAAACGAAAAAAGGSSALAGVTSVVSAVSFTSSARPTGDQLVGPGCSSAAFAGPPAGQLHVLEGAPHTQMASEVSSGPAGQAVGTAPPPLLAAFRQSFSGSSREPVSAGLGGQGGTATGPEEGVSLTCNTGMQHMLGAAFGNAAHLEQLSELQQVQGHHPLQGEAGPVSLYAMSGPCELSDAAVWGQSACTATDGQPAVELEAAPAAAVDSVEHASAAAAAAAPDLLPTSAAAAAAGTAGASDEALAPVYRGGSSVSAAISPFSAVAGAVPETDVQEATPSKAGEPNAMLVDTGCSLAAFASVLQMALTEAEAALFDLDTSMSFPFNIGGTR